MGEWSEDRDWEAYWDRSRKMASDFLYEIQQATRGVVIARAEFRRAVKEQEEFKRRQSPGKPSDLPPEP